MKKQGKKQDEGKTKKKKKGETNKKQNKTKK